MTEKNNSYKINGHVTLEKTQLIKQQRKKLKRRILLIKKYL